ncbi:hypothetical protein F5Y17DRAFT_166044 [Xylariaceae sp. FL0594]|nr:hypothetical protein F5Y17DRAFT_166044 [Xylariaceae sp. FL0594]
MAGVSFEDESLILNIILPVLALIAVTIRLVGRKVQGQPWKADDYTILICLILCLGLAGVEIRSATTNVLKEMTNGADNFSRFRKFQFAEILITHPLYGLTKISTLFLYRRIFTLGRTRKATIVLLVLTSVFIVASFFLFLFCAHNVSTFWTTPPEKNNTQWNINPSTLVLIFAVLDIALDIAVLITPIPAIQRLNLNYKKRIALTGVFLLGAFCLVCSIIRLHYGVILLQLRGQTLAVRNDSIRQNILWADVECYASTIAACLPTFPMVFRAWTTKGFIGTIWSVLSAIHLRTLSLTSRRGSSHANDVDVDDPRQQQQQHGSAMNLRPSGDLMKGEDDLELQSQITGERSIASRG